MGAKLLEVSPAKAIDKAQDDIVIIPLKLRAGFLAVETGLDGGGQPGETAGVVAWLDEEWVHGQIWVLFSYKRWSELTEMQLSYKRRGNVG